MALEALRALEELVPNLHAIADDRRTDAEIGADLEHYLYFWGGGALERLARARAILSEATADVVGDDQEIALLSGVPRWSPRLGGAYAAEAARSGERWWRGTATQRDRPLADGGALAAYVRDRGPDAQGDRIDASGSLGAAVASLAGRPGRIFLETPLITVPWAGDYVGCGGGILYTCSTDREPTIVADDVRAATPSAMVRRLADEDWEEELGEYVVDNWENRDYALIAVAPTIGPVVDVANPLFGLEDGSTELIGSAIIKLDGMGNSKLRD